MINEEKNNVYIYVINDNTGHICNHLSISTEKSVFDIAQKYESKDRTVLVKKYNDVYCFCIKGEFYILTTNTVLNKVLLEFIDDVLAGLYDHARDAFHIEMGKVLTLFKFVLGTYDDSAIDIIINWLSNIWVTRYYSIK